MKHETLPATERIDRLQGAHRCVRRAFTLIELLVVVVIIAILMTIGLGVANQVTQNGRNRTTQNMINVLDQAMTEYTSVTSGRIPADVKDGLGRFYPIIDGRPDDGTTPGPSTNPPPVLPSQALFMAIVQDQPSVSNLLTGIDPRFVQRLDSITVPGIGGPLKSRKDRTKNISVAILKDAWGEPIRFVHPKYSGGFGDFWGVQMAADGSKDTVLQTRDTLNIRLPGELAERSFYRAAVRVDPDAEGNPPWTGDGDEGLCTGGQPYFYSAGPDKDPGRRSDNIYTTLPNFTSESSNDLGV